MVSLDGVRERRPTTMRAGWPLRAACHMAPVYKTVFTMLETRGFDAARIIAFAVAKLELIL